jgi:hypothetical protein
VPNPSTPRLLAIASGVSDLDAADAKLEIGYSYLVAAMREQLAAWQSFSAVDRARQYWSKAVPYLRDWSNGMDPPGGSDGNGTQYLAYAYQVQHAMEADQTGQEALAVADQLTRSLARLDPPASTAVTMCLWRQAVLAGEPAQSMSLMHQGWKLFERAEDSNLGHSTRSPQAFAGALLWRAWTLALNNNPGAEQLFVATNAAINGVLAYPEMRFWLHAARRTLGRFDAGTST